ncbi:MAG: BREX-1 system adenine-specific DNA-methyltransferase PglX [Lachnospiraceae bacterium]|nr:BREX-1 system adenine-specific DNA-methyltransferase PglX [Lachnospiraceae bacterium]
MNKTAIKKFAIDARRKLIASVTDKAGMLGITEKGCSQPISQGADFKVYKTAADTEVTLNRKQCEQRDKLEAQINDRGFEVIVEEVAYTWFNRICAIRFMEVNDYLLTRVRVLSSEKKGKTEPDIVTQAPDVDLDFTAEEKEHIIELKLKSDSKSQDELFRLLFIKQCNKLHEVLPELFEKTSDYTELLLDISYTNKEEIVYRLVNAEDGIAEDDFNISSVDEEGENTGQVEIIGWLYQYYISEKHEEIVNVYKSTVKKEDIPAATQLFTTDWVVRYMVDNSLGRYWIERNPDSKLGEKLKYFVTPQDGHIEYVNEKIAPTELTFFDPCMGSGHILVYAFDVLMEIYRECGYSDRNAALNIVQFNLFGLDIDRRAHQLAYFAVMMKARSYNRRVLTQGVYDHIASIEESNSIKTFQCDGITNDKDQNEIGDYLVRTFLHAKEIGSLQTVEKYDYRGFYEYLVNIEKKELQLNFDSVEWIQKVLPITKKLTKQAVILSEKYSVVCTNPPYMNKFESNLKEFVTDRYNDYASDLFSVFMFRNFDFCVPNGYSGFMTPNVWMFLQSYEKLRIFIENKKSIITLIQFAKGAFFQDATVDICSFILMNSNKCHTGEYFRLEDFKGNMDVQKIRFLENKDNERCHYSTDIKNFENTPGNIIAYWVSDTVLKAFSYTPLGELAAPRQGMAPSDSNRFLRLWHEVSYNKIGFGAKDGQDSVRMKKKWYPYNKGGAFRKWYGNQDYVVNWKNDGYEVKEYARSLYKNDTRTIKNQQYYFKECISWSKISSGNAAFRYYGDGFVFSDAGMAVFSDDSKILRYIAAFLNSSVCRKLLEAISPTMNFEAGHIQRLPLIINKSVLDKVSDDVDRCICLAKQDWDSYENSWCFKRNPLVEIGNLECDNHRVELIYRSWVNEVNERRQEISNIEKELNSIFINTYNLQNEMEALSIDKDNVINEAEVNRDIKNLISYIVGCIFGRYSLDIDGLVYAGGEWNPAKYVRYCPDTDNIIPITDEEYFADDIVGLLCKWLKQVYGDETLEENLNYIAKALGNKGDSSREVIRNYFLKDFFIDHCKIYQKRPIYWLFDSGKENGFKALVYLHRYNPDTVGRVRTDYLHKEQTYVEAALRSAEYTIDNSSSASEKSKATKAVSKYTKQLAEMKIYDEAIAHIANQRIELDLDDGVKVNYEKFQGIEVSREGHKSLKIDLLAKIK